MADNTASLVVALSAQLTKFEKDMRDAGIMADKAVNDIENKFSKMNPSFAGASFIGNFFANLADKSIRGAIDALKDFYDRFILIDKEAKILGESMRDVFAFQEVAKAGGANIEQATRDLRTLATLLADMQRGDKNSLSRLFDAQPALQGVNRETLTLQQTLQIVANLIQNTAKGVEKIEVGKLAGLSEDTAISLGKAGTALTAMQAAAAGAAPNLDSMAEKAKRFESSMASAATWMKAMAVTTFGPLFTQQLRQDVPQALMHGVETLKTEAERRAEGRLAPEGPATRLPKQDLGAVASDYDRMTKSIEKQTIALEAEAATVGQSVGATEQYKVQLELTAAATRDHKEITEQLNAAITEQAVRAGRAKQALAENQFALQRLNSASQQVGSALSTAFADAIVDGKALNDVMKSLITTLEKAAINSLVMSFFTPAGGQTTSLFSSLFRAQSGTDFAPGGLALVGERGPELVNLPRGSQVMPNDITRSMMGGGGAITYAPMIDARGASVEAVARLAQIIEQDKQTFALRTVTTIQQARRGRVPGL
jgi:hypothetical protein